MQWKSLPRDLAEDILSRVPAVPLARLRSTSKQWNAILKSRNFAKLHTAKSPKDESLFITFIDSRVRFVRINLHDPSPSVKVAAHPFYLKDPLSDSSKEVNIRSVFQCDGLLLCSTKDNRLVVWEPYSGKTKWIKPRDRYEESDYYALGYDNKSSSKQYKILRLNRRVIKPINFEYEIYDFNSDSWRVLGVVTDWYLAPHHRRGISLKGNTYWVATRTGMQGGYDFILSFDFSKGMFQNLPLPNDFSDFIVALSVVEEEQLCMLSSRLLLETWSVDLQVWVTISTGSWNKSLALTSMLANDTRFIDVRSPPGTSFLADEQNTIVACLSPKNILHILRENKHIIEIDLGGGSARHSYFSVILNYAPSLAQINKVHFLGDAKGKRKACDL